MFSKLLVILFFIKLYARNDIFKQKDISITHYVVIVEISVRRKKIKIEIEIV